MGNGRMANVPAKAPTNGLMVLGTLAIGKIIRYMELEKKHCQMAVGMMGNGRMANALAEALANRLIKRFIAMIFHRVMRIIPSKICEQRQCIDGANAQSNLDVCYYNGEEREKTMLKPSIGI